MRKIAITFSGSAYDQTTSMIFQNHRQSGIDDLYVYDDRWLLRTEFYQENSWLWQRPDLGGKPRGFGWFCWKPYILLRTLEGMKPGDIVMFLDADTYPIHSLDVLFKTCDREDFMVFDSVGNWNSRWNKRDCLIVMAQDEERYRNCQHAVARFMLFKKGSWRVQQFLMEWLTYCINPTAQTFDHSTILPEYPEFHEHRTEQAIFTNLCHKYGLRLYREACQFGNSVNHDKDLYPQLFVQDGTRGFTDLKAGSAFRRLPDWVL